MTIFLREMYEANFGAWKYPTTTDMPELRSSRLSRKSFKILNSLSTTIPVESATLSVALKALAGARLAGACFHPVIEVTVTLLATACLVTWCAVTAMGLAKGIEQAKNLGKTFRLPSTYVARSTKARPSKLSFKVIRIASTIATIANLVLLCIAGSIFTAVAIALTVAFGNYLMYKLALTQFSALIPKERTLDLARQDDEAIRQRITYISDDPSAQEKSLSPRETLSLNLTGSTISDSTLNLLASQLFKADHRKKGHRVNVTDCHSISREGIHQLLKRFPFLEVNFTQTKLKDSEIRDLSLSHHKFTDNRIVAVPNKTFEITLNQKVYSVSAQTLFKYFPYFDSSYKFDFFGKEDSSISLEEDFQVLFHHMQHGTIPKEFLNSFDKMKQLFDYNDYLLAGPALEKTWNAYLEETQGVHVGFNPPSVTLIDTKKYSSQWLYNFFGNNKVEKFTLKSLEGPNRNRILTDLDAHVRANPDSPVTISMELKNHEEYIASYEALALHQNGAKFSSLQIGTVIGPDFEKEQLAELIVLSPELLHLEVLRSTEPVIVSYFNLRTVALKVTSITQSPFVELTENRQLRDVSFICTLHRSGDVLISVFMNILRFLKENNNLEKFRYISTRNFYDFLDKIRQKDPQLSSFDFNLSIGNYKALLDGLANSQETVLHPGLCKLTHLYIAHTHWDLSQFPKLESLAIDLDYNSTLGPLFPKPSPIKELTVFSNSHIVNKILAVLPNLPALTILKASNANVQDLHRALPQIWNTHPLLKIESL